MKQKQLLLIGFTVVLALCAVVIAILFLNPTPGDGKNIIKVRFQNIEKITAGTRVTFAGKPVGSVKKIVVLEEGSLLRTSSEMKGIYPYELILQVDSSVRVFPQDAIVIHTSGLMGEKNIAIIPMPITGVPLPPVDENTILYGKDSSSVESTLDTLSGVVHKADLTIDRVFSTIEKNQENFTSAATSLNQAFGQLNDFLSSLNKEQVALKLATVTDTAASCLEKYAALAQSAVKGNNTISRLLDNDALFLDLEKTVEKTDRLLDAVLEYGFLFHTNPNYRRSFLQVQQQPKEFQDIVDKARKSLLEAKKNLIDSSDPNEHSALIEHINNALLSLPSSHVIQKPRTP